MIIGTSLKTAYAGGMMAGVKKSSILKNYRYSAILDSIFFHGTLVTAAGFLSIIISPLFDPKPLDFSQIYFIVILVLLRVYLKTRRHLLMEPIKNGFLNKAYKELVVFSDEDRVIDEFVDDYTKFKRKITDNGKLSISEDKIENAWIENKLKSKTSYQPIFMVLIVNSITLLITEIAKDYGYKQVVQPWLKTIFENPNYIINILVFIGSMLILIYMSKAKK